MLEQLCAQAVAKAILRGAAESGRLVHAYLFAGPDGTGKSVAAVELASHAIGSPAEGHADFHVFAPERQNFLVEQAREVCRLSALRPYAGRRCVFVLKRAEALTGEAAATLLKRLEEPPGPALFVLLCTQAPAVAATLRSRCQVVPFGPVPPAELAGWLVARGVEGAAELAALSEGKPGLALELAADDGWRQRRARAEQLAAQVGAGDEEDELRRAAAAAADDGLLGAFGAALRGRLLREWPLEAIEAWFDAEAALAANVTGRLTWEVLLLRLRRMREVRYDAISPAGALLRNV